MQVFQRSFQTVFWTLAVIHTSKIQGARQKPIQRQSTTAFLHAQTLGIAGRCLRCQEAKHISNLDAPLVEASGLQASSKNPGVFYTMNDDPEKVSSVYMVDRNGTLLGSLLMDRLSDMPWEPHGERRFGDWEALALGPCSVGSSESCIYIADIGNNCARKDTSCPWMRKDNIYSLIRIPEPTLSEFSAIHEPISVTSRRLKFKYPDGPHDAETLVVAPGGRAYVVTKDLNKSGLYELPMAWLSMAAPPSAPPNATKLALLEGVSGELVADGDFSLDRGGAVTGLTIRTYSKVLHYPVQRDEPKSVDSRGESQDLSVALAKAVSEEPCQLASPAKSIQRKGEGLTWERDHSNSKFKLLLCGEDTASPILEVVCEAAAVTHSASRRAQVSSGICLAVLAIAQIHLVSCLFA